MRLSEIELNETIDNLFINDKDVEKRKAMADEVFALLTKSYAKAGGLKGSGTQSPEELITQIPFWKVLRHGTDIKAIVLYKDKNGRKRVAVGTDGSAEAKKFVAEQMILDALEGRAYAEISGHSLAFHKKSMERLGHPGLLDTVTVPVSEVPALLPKYEIIPIPGSKFEYKRAVGSTGELITKRLVGTTGKHITTENNMNISEIEAPAQNPIKRGDTVIRNDQESSHGTVKKVVDGIATVLWAFSKSKSDISVDKLHRIAGSR